jgi:hypothetical protein
VSRTSRADGARAVISLGRSLVAAAFCAQIAHAALYGSLEPRTGSHGYLAWYVPLVAVLALVAATVVRGSFATGVLATGRRSFGPVLPRREPGHPVRDVRRLAFASLAFLFAQESLEHAGQGGYSFAAFPPLTLLLAGLVLVLAAAAVVAVERTLESLVERLARAQRPRAAHSIAARRLPRVARRRHPLSLHRGLRAPPLAA